MNIKLLVGLGNPGNQYLRTRHNVGFDLVDQLAEQFAGRWQLNSKYQAQLCELRVHGHKLWLMKPQTFMNLSGKSVAGFCHFFKIPCQALAVAQDELALPPGTVKLKQGGGHNGHNGLKSIISCLGNQNDFLRLRIGIGHPGAASEVSNFVLGKAPTSEQTLIDDAIAHALTHLPKLLTAPSQAMNQINGYQAKP